MIIISIIIISIYHLSLSLLVKDSEPGDHTLSPVQASNYITNPIASAPIASARLIDAWINQAMDRESASGREK